MGAWWKTIKPQKLGNSSGSGQITKKRATQGVCSWTVQNVMRGVLGQMSAGAARRILISANPREELNSRMWPLRQKQVITDSSVEIEETCALKNLDEIACIQFKKKVDTKDKRENTRDCRGHKQHYPSGQLTSCVIPWEKRVSTDPL